MTWEYVLPVLFICWFSGYCFGWAHLAVKKFLRP